MTVPATIAHRGFAGVAPENTIDAVVDALEYPETTMVEIDVQPAADGTPVVFQDDQLDGTRHGRPITDAAGGVRETPLETVMTAEVLESGSTVPTLETLLETVPTTAAINIELKAAGTEDSTGHPGVALEAETRTAQHDCWLPFVERVLAECDAFAGELLFSSFHEGALFALDEVDSTLASAALLWDDLEAGLEIARRYECAAIHPPKAAIVGTGVAATGDILGDEETVDILSQAHKAGRAVNVWTVETWDEFDQLAAAGVDGIIAEYPGLGEVTGRHR